MHKGIGHKIKDFKPFLVKETAAKGNRVKPCNDFPEFRKEDIEQSIARRFEEQVRKYPDKVAVKMNSKMLTYDALNRQANRVSRVVLDNYDDRYRLNKNEKTRYTRQMLLPGWGIGSQERLKGAVAFVAGAGGSGSPLIMELALTGIGTIIVCDHDQVELSNLNRQALHDESRIGMNKALSAKITIRRINPNVNVIAYPQKITGENVVELVGDADIIFDNVDDMEAKFILSECAFFKRIPHIISSMIDLSSYAAIFHSPQTPCFHCLYDRNVLKEIEEIRGQFEDYKKIPNPVASPALFLSTGFVVNEAVKILLGFENPAYNRFFFFNQRASKDIVNSDGYRMITYPFNDFFKETCKEQGFDWDEGWSGKFVEELRIHRDPCCPLCGEKGNGKEQPLSIECKAPGEGKEVESIEIEDGDGDVAGTDCEVEGLQTAALLFGQNIAMIVAIMGVLKAGKVYVPLDATYPLERLEFMLEDSDSRLIVTDSDNFNLAVKLRDQVNKRIPIININELEIDKKISNPGTNPDIETHPGNAAYILYTSGSTGKPKGVIQNHRNVLHFARVYTNQLHLHPGDRLTLFSSYSFDAAKMDIYGALLNGAALYPFDIKQGKSFDRLPLWLKDEKITVFHSIPTVYRYFTDMLTGSETFPSIRFIVLGGEAVYKKDVEKYKRHFPDDSIFINGLGPTESTVTLQYFINKETEITRESIPVGYPVDETGVFLINENGEEAQILQKGEIIFKSDYLALGYLNRREKTEEVFVKDPLTREGRVYRTGDLGRRLPDGSIEYVGRKDFQVKVRGYRIELGEIESRLDKIEGIKKGVVVCQQGRNDENYLVAYYVKSPGKEIDENDLVQGLKQSLPDYMIPNLFIKMEDFPLTPTGKIDRKKLSGTGALEVLPETEYAAPETEKEQLIAGLWMEVLKLDKVGINDNFFGLGGHSLNVIQLNSKLKEKLGMDIPIVIMFRYPTINALAQYLEKGEFNMMIDRREKRKQGKNRLGNMRNRKKGVNDGGNGAANSTRN